MKISICGQVPQPLYAYCLPAHVQCAASDEDAQSRENPNRRNSFCERNWGESLVAHLIERRFRMLKFYNSFDVQPFYLNMYGKISRMTYLATVNNTHKLFFVKAMKS